MNVGYFRTWYDNFRVTDNLAVTAADYDPFCVTAQLDSRLPGGGGQAICGLYDIKPAKFGLVDNLVVLASNFGKQTEIYNGIDVTLSARFGKSGQFQGGFNTGRTVTDDCAVRIDSPQQRFCHQVNPFEGQSQIKLSASYPLPWELQASGVYQNLAGIPVTATMVATNAQIAPSLGRNLGQCRGAARCTGTVIVDVIEPFTKFEKRLQQVDVRLARTFHAPGHAALQATFDVYNLLNAVDVLSMTTRLGPAWLQPVEVLGGRMFKFGAQYKF
jgi:outer membrane receptor protein involved in Fe transport